MTIKEQARKEARSRYRANTAEHHWARRAYAAALIQERSKSPWIPVGREPNERSRLPEMNRTVLVMMNGGPCTARIVRVDQDISQCEAHSVRAQNTVWWCVERFFNIGTTDSFGITGWVPIPPFTLPEAPKP